MEVDLYVNNRGEVEHEPPWLVDGGVPHAAYVEASR
jgi:hypothetical protein